MKTKTATPTGVLGAAAALAVAALAMTAAAPATGAPAARVRFVAHLDLAAGQRPENIALEPDGSADVTFAYGRQVARITRDGRVDVLATLPAPPADAVTPALTAPFLGGIVRAQDGTLYFLYATGTGDLTGLWRLSPGGTPERVAALPADGLPNGLALDPRGDALYAADSVLGVVWRVPTTGGAPVPWATGPELEPAGFLGANGVKVHNGAVWVTNLDRGTVLRVPIGPGGAAGPVRIRATGLVNIDDFDFTGPGDTLLAAINADNEVALVQPDGTHLVVLTAADGLEGPTSVAVRGDTAYIASAAYFTDHDPDVLAARIAPGR
ncbi:hypothetical protein [Kitasatospora phosalacinea]|uniref:hypothetical protein n=1 Tax=Kitasatospora phosalacinea TaxID=2065 RepID=UPI000A3F01B7|nr:hypothetical protein [Kitasatospora phosalacinea]